MSHVQTRLTASDALGSGNRAPRLRSLPDRLRQVALYEIGGLCLICPFFALAAGLSPLHSAGLLALLGLIVAAWNGLYSMAFDWAEIATTGRSPDVRPLSLRAVHAAMLEAGAAAATTPVIAVWTHVSWNVALLEDFGLTIAYAAYAVVFGLFYDWLFPIDSERCVAKKVLALAESVTHYRTSAVTKSDAPTPCLSSLPGRLSVH